MLHQMHCHPFSTEDAVEQLLMLGRDNVSIPDPTAHPNEPCSSDVYSVPSPTFGVPEVPTSSTLSSSSSSLSSSTTQESNLDIAVEQGVILNKIKRVLPSWIPSSGYINGGTHISVKEAIRFVMPPGLLTDILSAINEERGRRYQKRASAELQRQEFPQKVVKSKVNETQTIPKKRKPISPPNSGVVQNVVKKNKVRFSSRIHQQVRSVKTRFYSSVYRPFQEHDVFKFMSVLLFCARQGPPSFSELWKKTGLVKYSAVQDILSRERFMELHASMRVSEEFLIEIERRFCDHMRTIWKPANISVVDESICPFKGHSNPNHVFIPRKPHPNGIKVSCHVFLDCCSFPLHSFFFFFFFGSELDNRRLQWIHTWVQHVLSGSWKRIIS